MGLGSGKRLGPYEIVSPLGAGGMGEVYRAKDTRIGRDVALKILPSTYSENAERLRRFEQEARTAGLLTHPNILAIYDVGSEDGSPYLVSELLEGETLREKLRAGAIPMRRTIDYGIQLAAGLAAAHEKGIIHRDLKPENLFVTKDGRLKILDFGLAKLHLPDSLARDSNSQLQTRASESTPGVVLGTVGYMSPEQVRGLSTDHRSDVFGFGAVLYEMLSGKRAFAGNTTADTISAILQSEPAELSGSPALERIVRHCLEKDPDLRFQSARDVGFALEAISGTSDTQRALEALPPLRKNQERLWKIIATICFLAAIVAGLSRFPKQFDSTKLLEVSILPPQDRTISDVPVISPDGLRIAFVAIDKNGKSSLWVRPLDSSKAQELPGTEDAVQLFWSPDSRWIGFFAEGKLKKIDISAGPPQPLCDISDPRGGTWSKSGTIVFAPNPGEGLYKIAASGGSRTPVTSLDLPAHEATHRWPSFLPDGIHFLYYVQGDKAGIYIGSLDSHETVFLMESEHAGNYAPPGYLLFQRSETLMAQRFDAASHQLSGEPFPLSDQVWFDSSLFGIKGVSSSENGVLSFLKGSTLSQVLWFDRNGKPTGSIGPPGDGELDPIISQDGKRMAIGIGFPSADVWIYETSSGNRSRITFDPADDSIPVWSPDGNKILFASNRSGLYELYLKSAGGSGNEERLLKSGNWILPDSWSPDNRYILYEEIDPKTRYDVWVLPLEGERKPFPFLNKEANEAQARFSPDGRFVAYCSDESGQPEIYVQSFPQEAGGKWQVSLNGGLAPKWSRDGKELFYLSVDRKLMSVEVRFSPSFHSGEPQVLFQTPILYPRTQVSAFFGYYDPAIDGQHFLMTVPLSRPVAITLITNWPALLQRAH